MGRIAALGGSGRFNVVVIRLQGWWMDWTVRLGVMDVAEVQDVETENILCVTCSRIDSYGTAWFGQISGVRKYDLSDEDLWGLLKPLPDEQVYPLAPPSLDVHDHQDTDRHYIKRANLIGFDDAEVAKILPTVLLEEAKVLQSLRQHPHPNLVKFHGYILKDNRIAGLVLEKYPRTLQQNLIKTRTTTLATSRQKHGCMACMQAFSISTPSASHTMI
ncbi:hypothetical protein LTR27_008108 [Elasticomyces elasticus]|nr:hypothetical protein LTR27_008108 [Elasticomyces elasticus]